MSGKKNGNERTWPTPTSAILLLVVVSLFGAIPLLQPGLYASHDGVFHVYRLQALDQALQEGVAYPRWASDFYFGYGSPIFNYLPMLPYYISELFHVIGFGYIDATKALGLFALLLAPIGAWLYARALLPEPAAVAVGIAYAFVPYRFVDLYTRGNFPEYLAFVWFPLILWAFRKLVWEGDKFGLAIGSLALAALLMTHVPSAALFFVALGLHILGWLALQRSKREVSLFRVVVALALSGLIASVYLLPAFLEQYAVYADRVQATPNVLRHFPSAGLAGLLSFDLVHDYALGELASKIFPYRVGLAQWLLAMLGGFALFLRWRRSTPVLRFEAVLAIILFALAVLMCLSLIRPLWQASPLLRTIQFPWRWLMIAALPSALLAGVFIDALPARWKVAAALALAVLIVPNAIFDLRPPQAHLVEEQVTAQGQQALESAYAVIGTITNAEWVPRTVGVDIATVLRASPWSLERLRGENGNPISGSVPGQVEAEVMLWEGERRSVRLHASQPSQVAFNLFHFPGWRAWVDDSEVQVILSPEGFISIAVPAGSHRVTLRFDDTWVRRIANMLSLAGLLIASAVLWKQRPTIRLGRPRFDKGAGGLVLAGLALLGVAWWSYGAPFRTVYPFETPHRLEFEGGLVLEGYTIEGLRMSPNGYREATPGENLTVNLYWSQEQGITSTNPPRFYVRLSTYRREWGFAMAPQTMTADTDGLQRSQGVLHLPVGLPPGAYQLGIGAWSEDSEVRLLRFQHTAAYSGVASAGFFLVTMPAFQASHDVLDKSLGVFGNEVAVLDADVFPAPIPRGTMDGSATQEASDRLLHVSAGEPLRVSLLFKAETNAPDPLTIVVRLLNEQGDLYAVDHEEPAGGLYPNQYWQGGQLVREVMDLPVPVDAPPGPYRLALELHKGRQALPLRDAQGAPIGTALTLANLDVQPALGYLLEAPTFPTIPVAEGVELLSVEHADETAPGQRFHVLLSWWGRTVIGRELAAELILADEAGRTLATAKAPIGGDNYPTSRWRPNERIRQWFRLAVPADMPWGDQRLMLRVVALNDQRLAEVDLGRVMIVGRQRSFDLPQDFAPMDIALGDTITLRGYRLGDQSHTLTRAQAGQVLPVLLAWQAQAQGSRNLAVSVQVIDREERLVAQHDSIPQEGRAPVPGWLPDEVVEDSHAVRLPLDLAPGGYSLLVVVYDAETGQRLVSREGRDSLFLQTLIVER